MLATALFRLTLASAPEASPPAAVEADMRYQKADDLWKAIVAARVGG